MQAHRGIAAGTQTFTFFERELPVRRRLVEVNAKLVLEVICSNHSARQRTWQIGTQGDFVTPYRAEVVHCIETGGLVNSDRGHAQVLRNKIHGVRRKPAFLALCDGQGRHHGRLTLICRIFGERLVDERERFRRQHHWRVHRSTSPNTMSCVPITATTSASMCPRTISSSAARCAKPGARILSRYGLLAPSDTR